MASLVGCVVMVNGSDRENIRSIGEIESSVMTGLMSINLFGMV